MMYYARYPLLDVGSLIVGMRMGIGSDHKLENN